MPKPYRVYAVHFSGRPERASLFLGEGRHTHEVLIARRDYGLGPAYQADPHAFLMGRLIEPAGRGVAVDTGSDKWFFRTREPKPMSQCSPERRRLFEDCLRGGFPGQRILLIEDGLDTRVSDIDMDRWAGIFDGREVLPNSRFLERT